MSISPVLGIAVVKCYLQHPGQTCCFTLVVAGMEYPHPHASRFVPRSQALPVRVGRAAGAPSPAALPPAGGGAVAAARRRLCEACAGLGPDRAAPDVADCRAVVPSGGCARSCCVCGLRYPSRAHLVVLCKFSSVNMHAIVLEHGYDRGWSEGVSTEVHCAERSVPV